MEKIYSKKYNETYQVISGVLISALLFWAVGFPLVMNKANAAMLTEVTDTISTSNPGDPSNHTIVFTVETTFEAGDGFSIDFGNNAGSGSDFDLSSIVFGDVDIDTGADRPVDSGCGTGDISVLQNGQTLDFAMCGGNTIATGTVVTILVGTNATGGTNQIVNNTTPGSFELLIEGSQFQGSATRDIIDVGFTRIVMIDDVVVTASVLSTFTFAITGVATDTPISLATSTATTTGESYPTTVPFGTLTAGDLFFMAQDLTVVTNASNGFQVTVEHDGNLRSSSGADIDGFIDGAWTDTPTAWQSPATTLNDEDTYGHMGISSDDTGFSFTEDEWISASTTPRVMFDHPNSTDGTITGEGTTRIGYQIEISALQEAGNDYTNTLTYIATPTF